MSRCIKYQKLIAEGKWADAILGLIEELRSDPEYAGAFYNLGLAFLELNLKELARAFFAHYLEIEPEGFWASRAREKLVEFSDKGKNL